MKISVVIRNKNQVEALSFLLNNLKTRYATQIDEVIVIDNLSKDGSQDIAKQYGARVVTIQNFSYGGSANLAASSANSEIVVLFSAHSYPVSHDFFNLIKKTFENDSNLAGVRCLHNASDYRNYIKEIHPKKNPNTSGLIFSGSAFKRSVWQKLPFKENVATFEDKEWSRRVLSLGYHIALVPAIFCYEIKRTKSQNYFRFKNDLVGNYQLWGIAPSWKGTFWGLLKGFLCLGYNVLIDIYYLLKRFFRRLGFLINKPSELKP